MTILDQSDLTDLNKCYDICNFSTIILITLCMVGKFLNCLSTADFWIHFVEPDLGPNYSQRISADDTSRDDCTCIIKTNLYLQ